MQEVFVLFCFFLCLGSQSCSVDLCACYFDDGGLENRLKSGNVMPAGLFFLRIGLAVQGLLWIHIDFRTVFSISLKMSWGCFFTVYTGSINGFGSYGHFNNVLSIRKHRLLLHFLVSSSVSCIKVIVFTI